MAELSGQWYAHTAPFRHYRADNVLAVPDYQRVAHAFKEILAVSEKASIDTRYTFRRSGEKNYDAWTLAIDHQLKGIFSPFFEPGWISALAALMSLPETGRVDAGLHSSPPASRTGWIHTDLCSGWFHEGENKEDGILFPDKTKSVYFTGEKKTADAKPVEYIRAATMIYYCCNDDWVPGCGGETALYGSAVETPATNRVFVPPINNTLLLFECSPHSYHRFITNPGLRRNSLILWLHVRPEYAEANWGSFINRRNKT